MTDFLQSAFFGNVDYVGWQNSFLGIPQGLLMVKTVLLLGIISFIYWQRKRLSKPTIFVIVWFVFSFYNAFFSERPYTHYAIVLLPSLCLLIGLFFVYKTRKARQIIALLLLVCSFIICLQFRPDVVKAYLYYQNAIEYMTNNKNIQDYQSFFDPKVPRDYAVASFIMSNTLPSDNVFIWGNNPQIYALSHKLPPGKYTVAYHITQNDAIKETQQAIQSSAPKYIIILTESPPLPFDLPLYIMRYSIDGATIYERSF